MVTARESFLATMEREGMAPEIARKILRHSQTWARERKNQSAPIGGLRRANAYVRVDAAERLIREWCARIGGGPDGKLAGAFTPTFTDRVTLRVPSGAEVVVPTG